MCFNRSEESKNSELCRKDPQLLEMTSQTGFRRTLSCIEYPFAEEVELSDRKNIIHLVTWLEDLKIRDLELSERELLRQDSNIWNTTFSNYLDALECPYEWPLDSNDCLIWLISYAVSAQYSDCSDSWSEVIQIENDSSNTMIIQDATEMNEQLSNINSSDVDSIGSLLGLARNGTENNPDYLQRISKVVSLFLTPGCIEALKTNNDGGIPLDAFPLGFDTGDIDVNQTATVLKMLYLSDFREMQNDLNSLLLLGQEYTANPRTNTKLGKVGR